MHISGKADGRSAVAAVRRSGFAGRGPGPRGRTWMDMAWLSRCAVGKRQQPLLILVTNKWLIVTCISSHSIRLSSYFALSISLYHFVARMSSKVLNNLVIAVIVNNAFARAEQAAGSLCHAM